MKELENKFHMDVMMVLMDDSVQEVDAPNAIWIFVNRDPKCPSLVSVHHDDTDEQVAKDILASNICLEIYKTWIQEAAKSLQKDKPSSPTFRDPDFKGI